MTTTLRADRFAAYLADLEAYIAQHGHLPAPSQATPRTDKPRLQRMLASDRVDAAVKVRIVAVLAAPSWQQRRKIRDTAQSVRVGRLAAYLSGLESYVAVHGHLPSSGEGAIPRMKKTWLQRHLGSAGTDAATRERITALLEKPSYQARSAHAVPAKDRRAADRQMAALAEAAATLPGLSSRQAEILAWILHHRRLPATGSTDTGERNMATRLSATLRSALNGTAKVTTARFVLAVPNLVTGADRDKISALAEARDAARQAYLRALEASRTRLGPLEDRWDKGFAELTAWVEDHGELPRRRTNSSDEYRVANWLNVQRVQFRAGNLDAGWVGRLRTVPGALEPKARKKSDADYARSISDFHAAHGRLPRADVPAPEGTAGIHLQKLGKKAREGALDPEPLAILAAVPGALSRWQDRKAPRQRLAELEAYVEATGQFPVQGAQGLSNWAYRALRGHGCRSGDPVEGREIRKRVMALRASVPYVKLAQSEKLPVYLDALESFIREHGHVPPATVHADLRLDRQRLRRLLESAHTDEVTCARIRAVLAAAPYRRAAA